jgi:hypothetical protein
VLQNLYLGGVARDDVITYFSIKFEI